MYIEQDAKAGAIKPVRRAAWECTCAGARIGISFSLSLALCCGGFLNHAPLTQRGDAQRIEMK